MLAIILNTVHVLTNLLFLAILKSVSNCYSHFAGKEIEAQEGYFPMVTKLIGL